MIAQLACRILGHRRCVRLAYVVKGRWRSRCKRCGTELIRVAPQDWQAFSDVA